MLLNVRLEAESQRQSHLSLFVTAPHLHKVVRPHTSKVSVVWYFSSLFGAWQTTPELRGLKQPTCHLLTVLCVRDRGWARLGWAVQLCMELPGVSHEAAFKWQLD